MTDGYIMECFKVVKHVKLLKTCCLFSVIAQYSTSVPPQRCRLSHSNCVLLTNLKRLFVWNRVRMNGWNYLFSDFCFQNKQSIAVLNLSDRYVPTLLKSLRTQKVVHICCGEDHTAALTKVQYLKICLCFHFQYFKEKMLPD